MKHEIQPTMPATRHSGRTPAVRFSPYNYGACPSKPVDQDEYFYAADGSDEPIVTEATTGLTVYTYPPRNVTALSFDPTKWQNVPRPANYHGPWPPTSASELMNTGLIHDYTDESPKANKFYKQHGDQTYLECLGKYCWQNTDLPNGIFCVEDNCTHTTAEWLTGASEWKERFQLGNTACMGSGLFSKQLWSKGDILGMYLGELIPLRTSNTDYCHEVVIGPAFTKTEAPVAYIDAKLCGNYVRFCNHSCENNAYICEGRIGKERVLVLRAAKRIAADEQVTVDYGTDYFRDRQCLCGSSKCRYSGAAHGMVATDLSEGATE